MLSEIWFVQLQQGDVFVKKLVLILFAMVLSIATGAGAQDAATEASLLRRQADRQLAAGKYRRAKKSYERLLRQYAAQIELEAVLARVRAVAEAFASGEASFLGSDERDEAIALYELILERAPSGARAPDDMLRLAELQVGIEDFDAALRTYRELERRFPDSEAGQAARLARARVLLQKAEYRVLDQALAQAAQRDARRFRERYPQALGAGEALRIQRQAEERLAEYLLYLAEFYTRPAHYRPEAARRYLQRLLDLYADTAVAGEARMMLARLRGLGADEAAPGMDLADIKRALAEARELPEPPAVEPPEPPPYIQGPTLIQERERVTKWLLPITDLGL